VAKILMPLPLSDFDPSESAIPWQIISSAGHAITFSTPNGKQAHADPCMLRGDRLGPLAGMLAASKQARCAYVLMEQSEEFKNPIPYLDIVPSCYDGILLPGGHAPGMREYLESEKLQEVVSSFFEENKPVGAICHGVVLAARSKDKFGLSVLHDRNTTALPAWMEWSAYVMTCWWMGSYYRTYPTSVEKEVTLALRNKTQFLRGPLGQSRDSPENQKVGFCLRDGNYVSARWPGDCNRFSSEFLKVLK
jgi:protease I